MAWVQRIGKRPTRNATAVLPWRRLRVEALERRDLLAVNLVSASLGGGSGERLSGNPQISEDGRFAVFESSSNNLVAGDFNSPTVTDIFRRDLLTNQTVLVSQSFVSSSGGNGNSFNAQISADGRYVTWVSNASDLQVNDTNGATADVFTRDMSLNQTTILSRTSNLAGTGAGASASPQITRDGRFIVFHSAAPDLVVAGLDTNGTVLDVFVWDRQNPNMVTLLSTPFNAIGSGNGPSSFAVIAGNGSQVSFVSNATNLVFNDTNGAMQDVFVRPTVGGSIFLVSANTSGGSGNLSSNDPRISDDGDWIAFTSLASNLVTSDFNGLQDIFLRNRVGNTTVAVSVDTGGIATANGPSASPAISRNNNVVGYTSTATNLVTNDVNGTIQDVFVRNRLNNVTLLVSANTGGPSGNNNSSEPDLSFDGRYVAFSSTASNLVINDSNGAVQDVFRRDTATLTTLLVSTSITGFSGNSTSLNPRIDDSGDNIVFASSASNLVVNDTNGTIQDVFHFFPGTPPSLQSIVTGPDRVTTQIVRVLDAATFAERRTINPYPGFSGGIRVATGDVNGDGTPDIITAPGANGGPHIRVFDGNTGAQLPGLIGSFNAYNPAFGGGVFVAAGDVTGDGRADIITGPGAGGGPHIRIFNGATGAVFREFFAYNGAFTGGVQVGAGDTNSDGRADVITGAGPGGGPHVRVWSGLNNVELLGFNAYNPAFGGGVFVSGGDINADGRADIITGPGQGGGPHVRVFSGLNGAEIFGFLAYASNFTGGVRVGTVDSNNDGRLDIIAATGPGTQTTLRVFSGVNRAQLGETSPYPGFTGGVFVAGTKTGAPGGSPLRAAGGMNPLTQVGSDLDDARLRAIVGAALLRLDASGLPPSTLDRLDRLSIDVADLPADLLGLSSADTILIDRNAAGYGWFIDATPLDDTEFLAAGDVLLVQDKAASGGIDLLSVLVHELGHALGLEDLDPHLFAADAMASRLGPGVRRTALAAVDAVFGE